MTSPSTPSATSDKNKEEKKENEEKKSPKKGEKTERNKESSDSIREDLTVNFKNQLNDKLSKLQQSLQGFITETEFDRFKAETRERAD